MVNPPVPGHVVAHDLDRRRTLRSLQSGHVRRSDVCDADRSLTASAEVLGAATDRDCPVCGAAHLQETYWIHGSSIGEKSGTARSLSEIRSIVATLFPEGAGRSAEELTVHTVEVCLRCGWNYLIREDRYGTDDASNPDPASSSTERPAR
ncbi:MAG: DUF5318 family protein [Corynebacterium sp.]|uniref:DUF5318 family protein n=1 Tax=Corynebacterium sp. TaxID=1720 RepID=UPI003F9BA8B5